MLAPEIEEEAVGKAEVHAVFSISKVGNIAGCKVIQGEMRRNGRIRVMRGKPSYEGEMALSSISKMMSAKCAPVLNAASLSKASTITSRAISLIVT